MDAIAVRRAAAGLALAALVLAAPGCAWRKTLQRDMAAVGQRVDGVEEQVEADGRRLKDHDSRLATLGSILTSQDARLRSVEGSLGEVRATLRGKLVFKEVLRSSDARFRFDSADLTPASREALDRLVSRLVSENRGVYLEIQGHTDDRGPARWNKALGRQRAEAVLEYLHLRYRIPLHRIGVVSLGETAPIADNHLRDGRAQNRRVDVLVLE